MLLVLGFTRGLPQRSRDGCPRVPLPPPPRGRAVYHGKPRVAPARGARKRAGTLARHDLMETLVDLIPEIERLGNREAVRFHNGFRTWTLSYRALHHDIAAFVHFLDNQEAVKGDRLLLWGENRPEWVAVFWASIARGVEVVPLDFRSSPELMNRIQQRVRARWLVHGSRVKADGAEDAKLRKFSFEDLDALDHHDFKPMTRSKDDVVQIVFTSGTTGEPKGVVHRHRHLCANLTPVAREIEKYKRLARPFQPIRILDLLPLSHLFGQSLGLFIPVVLGGSVVFAQDLQPGAILETLRRERVSVLVSVPQLLRNLRHHVEPRLPSPPRKGWWKNRSLHRELGWKFWALVVGGARLATEDESFWRRLGFVVAQGYGLTETSPAVTVNHPFHTTAGSLGKVVGEQEVKIAPDGEILVRGATVVAEYLGGPTDGASSMDTFVDDEGWLHTGDLGRIDDERRLYFRGRKKDVIVTADGLNILPQDVEAVLNQFPEVKESVVLGRIHEGRERVQAVLLLNDSKASVQRLVSQANESLEPHQRIRSWSIWPDEDFPRTASTLKIKRREMFNRLQAFETSQSEPKPATEVMGILANVSSRDVATLRDNLRLSEDLGLSSLEQLDLLSRLEEVYGVTLDEEALSETETVGKLRAWLEQDQLPAPLSLETLSLETVPRWDRSRPVRWARTAISELVFWPLLHRYIELSVDGLENLQGLRRPVLFAANHNSHLDTPAIIASLPFAWRNRVAPAMMQERFRAYFDPRGQPLKARWRNRFEYYLATCLFNAYPLPHEMSGVRSALKFTGELVDHGFCPLVYPEGERSPDGTLKPFKSGIGLMAVRLRLPVVPIHHQGMFEIYSLHDSWPRTGRVHLRIGTALRFSEGDDYQSTTEVIREAIEKLGHG